MSEAWNQETLEEACEITYGERVIKKRDAGTAFPVYGGGGETFRIDRFNREDCTIVSRFGMSAFCVRNVAGKFFLNDSGLSVRPKNPAKLLPRFLDYFLYASQRKIYSLGRGSAQKNLDVKAFRRLEIGCPGSLPEQKGIVAILDGAFAGIGTAIANTQKNRANARELFNSYLNSVFIKNSSAWGKVRLETICEKITVGHVGSMASWYKPEGVPLLRSQNIRPFNVDLNKVVFIDEGFHKELKKSALQPGDLGIVRTGYPGTAAVIPDSLPVANCSDLVIVRPGERVLSDFLAIVFNSYYGKKEVAGVLVGAAHKHFNVTAAKAALIPLPAIDEQRRVVVECSDLREEHQRLESIYQQKLTALTELKQSLLQKAFAGELTADRAGHEIEGAAIAARISSRVRDPRSKAPPQKQRSRQPKVRGQGDPR